ncbi:hypothetical protein IJM86_06410 [bacterium]|nr:hypothetical protein [bacterium]
MIEMVFVMIILGIMTMMTLKMTTEQIEKVQHKSVKESLLSTYQKYYTKNLTSSYHKGKRYENLIITFATGENHFDFTFSGKNQTEENTGTFEGAFTIEELSFSGGTVPKEQITLTLTPYQLGCSISDNSDNSDNLKLKILVQEEKEYCFEISPKTCRMTGGDDCTTSEE